MFKKGELVVYGRTGICEITDITTMNMDGVPKDKMYYILKPLRETGGRIFTPVNNQKIIMRRILSREEALALIDVMPEIEELGIVSDKQREAIYKDCMKNCDCDGWVKVIKTLYLRKQERVAQGKKITATDEKYLKIAEESLYGEFALALDVPEEKMEDYITDRIENMNVNAPC